MSGFSWTNSKYSRQYWILNNLMGTSGILKESAKDSTLSGSRATSRNNQNKDSDNSPGNRQQFVELWLQMRCNSHFGPAIFWELPIRLLPSQVLRTHNKTKQGGNSSPCDRKYGQPVDTWTQIHKSQFKDQILMNVFSLPIWMGRQSEFSLSFNDEAPPHIEIAIEKLTLVRILTFCRLLPVFSGFICRLWREWGVSQQVSS